MKLSMITDGTTNTAMWSEWVRGKNTNVGKQAVWTGTQNFSPFPSNRGASRRPSRRSPSRATRS